ncbi:MAG: ABC transporter transmembrane domain-containing protein [Dongiaceae bacterium]
MILIIVIIAQIFYFLSLELPKTIVNSPIQGEGFESPESVANFLAIDIELPGFLSFLGTDGTLHLFSGFPLERIPYLIALTVTFLVLVLINGGFKLQINTMKGRMGERMLRRLRYQLFDRVMRFPLTHFRKVKQAEVATMIKDEVEPLGGFIGDAFVQPAFLGGQALTALIFILSQSFYLGLITVGVLVIQLAAIPPLRKPVLRLGKERQITARQLAGRIAENVDGAASIHVHDTSNYERADIVDRLGLIFSIRFRLYQLKFVVKFVNNLLAQLTPFLFYLVGGYLAITGNLDIGGLVAAIGAYKDLPGPVKELLDWYQQLQQVQISYEQVVEQFQPDSMLPPEQQDPNADSSQPLAGEVAAANLIAFEEGDRKLLDGASFSFHAADHVAVMGEGREAVAQALAGLLRPAKGSISIGGLEVASMPEAITGRRIGYVSQDGYLGQTTIRRNLIYGLRHRPLRPPNYDSKARQLREAVAAEARRAGNPDLDPAADWIDYHAAGASGPDDLDDRLIDALQLVDLEEDIFQFGLRRTIDPQQRPDLAADIVRLRGALRERLNDPQVAGLVEPFDRDHYNRNMSVAENLMFGTTRGGRAMHGRVDGFLHDTLGTAGLIDPLMTMGRHIAETMVELFADLPSGHPFFEQFSFIEAENLPDFQALLAHIDRSGLEGLAGEDRSKLVALSLPYVEARHRLGLIDEAVEEQLLLARRSFAERLPPDLQGAVEFYDEASYNASSTLQDNILFGRLVYGQAQAAERIGRLMVEMLDNLGLRRSVIEVGLDYEVGTAAKRLTLPQRLKLDLARTLVKRPDLLIVNEATSLLDGASEAKVMERILAARPGQGVVWTLHRTSLARHFQRALVLRGGRVVEQGTPGELSRPGTAFHELAAAE